MPGRSEVRFDFVVLEKRPGFASLQLSGKGVGALAQSEPGGHRFQRLSPTDKRGRIHSSTVTVAVLEPEREVAVELKEEDCRFDTYRATGAGGQHRNRRDSAVRVTHIPTGLVTRAENNRSQHINKREALDQMHELLLSRARDGDSEARSTNRRLQVGTAERSDKQRTVRMQDNTVRCHRTGRKGSAKRYLKGDLSWLC